MVSEYLRLMIPDKIMTFAGIPKSVAEMQKYKPEQQNRLLHKFVSERPQEPELLRFYMGVVINMVAKSSSCLALQEYETCMWDSFANKKVTICQGAFKSPDFIMASSPLLLFPSIRNEEPNKTPVQVCENSLFTNLFYQSTCRLRKRSMPWRRVFFRIKIWSSSSMWFISQQ